ncbi:Chloroperoxidase [Phaeosphaeriaceae sp. PMI808]|nr:Chloroperoxidase [Phaeosphaeriaceae sp. PMI808]
MYNVLKPLPRRPLAPYTPPTPDSSRSACPMLNALANHSILPHSGKNIPFRTLSATVRSAFNFAPSFCFFVPKFAADFLDRSYWTDSFDLTELSKHNAIEHDASLTRRDVAFQEDQGTPDLELVRELLACATGEGGSLLTKGDLSAQLAKRRAECRKSNGAYTESFFHNGFGSANSSTMLTIFGGRVEDLRVMLEEERFVEGWEPRILNRFGLTMAAFNGTVIPVELGVKRAKVE